MLGLRRYPCPQCGREMTPTGKNFRAPKQRVAGRADSGVTFDSRGGGVMPTNPKAAMRLARDLETQRRTLGAALLSNWTKAKTA